MNSVADEEQRSDADPVEQHDCTVFLLDQEGRVASWDPRAEQIKGYRAEEILGKHFSIFYPPEERAAGAIQQSLRRALETDRCFAEGWRIRKDGSRFFARVVISPVRDEAGVLQGFSKITRVASSQAASSQAASSQDGAPQFASAEDDGCGNEGGSDSCNLAVLQENGRATDREAEPHLIRNALLLANMQDAVVVTDLAGRVTSWNEGATRLFGWTAEEMLGSPLAKRFPESMRGAVAEQTEALAERGEWEGEFHDCRKDGSRIWIDARVRRMANEAGEAIGFIGISRDITERKEAQESLRREKELIAAVIENLPGIFYLFDLHGIYRRWNGNALRITGSTPQDLLDRDPLEFICPEDRERAGATMREVVESGEATVEADLLAGDGTRVPYLFTGKRVVIDGIPCITGMGIDFSERKKLEEQVRQAHKMEAVGRLAGGIAHDFNNLLTVINGFSDLLRELLEGHEEALPLVEEVLQAGEQAAKLTGQLLAFSRKEMQQPRIFDLNALIRDYSETLPELLGAEIALTLRLAPELAGVEGDASQLKQALTNLVVNAQDAMPSGGRLTIETTNADLSLYGERKASEIRPGHYVRLLVADTGRGMDRGTQARVFEPFFSTKEQSKGSGLGLAMVYGIIRQSGGYIFIHSTLGEGTRCEILLPAVSDHVPTEPAERKSDDCVGGPETVLLVEDEPGVRKLVQHLLVKDGYEVLEASDGAAALKIAAQHAAPIHLLLTDVVMPGMSGRELAKRLSETRPGLNVLYMSGYTDDQAIRQGISAEQTAFIQKPFSMKALAEQVREIMSQRK